MVSRIARRWCWWCAGRLHGAGQDAAGAVRDGERPRREGRARPIPRRVPAVRREELGGGGCQILPLHARVGVRGRQGGAGGDGGRGDGGRVGVAQGRSCRPAAAVRRARHHLRGRDDGRRLSGPRAVAHDGGRRGAPAEEPQVRAGVAADEPQARAHGAADGHARAEQHARAVGADALPRAAALQRRGALHGGVRRPADAGAGGEAAQDDRAVPAAAPEGGRGDEPAAQGGDHHRGGADGDPEEVLPRHLREEHARADGGHVHQERAVADERRHGAAQVLQPPVPDQGHRRPAREGRDDAGGDRQHAGDHLGQARAPRQAAAEAAGRRPPRAHLQPDGAHARRAGALPPQPTVPV
mmetsp:Transcript_16563/g.57902  ORF Transcript_16563/g.57902 Transcript_16563/m.57902 type:complete len:355 (-) Transcript_16563:963-2027(-)